MIKRSWTRDLISCWILSGSRRNEEDACAEKSHGNIATEDESRCHDSQLREVVPETMRLFSAVPLAANDLFPEDFAAKLRVRTLACAVYSVNRV